MLAPVTLCCGMERHFEMTFGGVAHHLRQRQRLGFGPGNISFAFFQGLAKIAHQRVGVFASV